MLDAGPGSRVEGQWLARGAEVAQEKSVVAVVADLVEVVEAGPALRARAASALAPCIAALAMLALPAAARAVVLEDAVSITQLLCVSEDATSPPINEAVDYSCLGLPYPGDGSSTSGANVTSKFGPAPAVSAHADCADAQGETSTWSSSRVSYELTIAQIATPPHTIGNVPVVISTMGSAVVSTLGMLGARQHLRQLHEDGDLLERRRVPGARDH